MKTKTFINKLKMAVIMIAISALIVTLASCEEDQPDPFVGNWSLESTELTLNFEILKRHTSGYHIQKVGVALNGSDEPPTYIGIDKDNLSPIQINGVGYSISLQGISRSGEFLIVDRISIDGKVMKTISASEMHKK